MIKTGNKAAIKRLYLLHNRSIINWAGTASTLL